MSFPSIRLRSAAPFLRIIGLLSLVLALSGCSAVQFGYNSLGQLGYWWLDGFFDFDAAQGAAVRDDLARIHAWHRANELPLYGQVLQRLERMVPADVTPAQVCGLEPELRARADALRVRIEPALTAHALTMQPSQIEHLERKYQQRNRDYEKEWVRLSPADLVDKRLEQFAGRAEILYGRLDDDQRDALRQQLQGSRFNPVTVLALKRRNQQAVLALLRRFSTHKVDIPQARAAVRSVLDEVMAPSEPALSTYVGAMRQEICAISAALHNSTRPSQREHAAKRLRGWQRDVAELSAQP
ncbi:DUF6279 family lipoprotein [Ramlibacter sp. MMS24-I3-19]|uniref:DUF6279 family lipoprotein n=1 Tax=Ramlibacter sp. MMS24-I3-19 TaxID=3416606 RepID=UPI003CFECFD9